MKIFQARIIRSAGYGFIRWKRAEGKEVKFAELHYRSLYDFFCDFLTAWSLRRVSYQVVFSLNRIDKDISSYSFAANVMYSRRYNDFLFEYWNDATYNWKQVSWSLYETISD